MVKYECDMCGKLSLSPLDMNEIAGYGIVCNECYRKVGEFITGYKKRTKNYCITIDPKLVPSGEKS